MNRYDEIITKVVSRFPPRLREDYYQSAWVFILENDLKKVSDNLLYIILFYHILRLHTSRTNTVHLEWDIPQNYTTDSITDFAQDDDELEFLQLRLAGYSHEEIARKMGVGIRRLREIRVNLYNRIRQYYEENSILQRV